MGDVTKIEWCDYTFNPWIGCAKVHAGCTNCYAEADFDKRRHFATWGPSGTRVLTSPANWAKPRKWNRDAEKAGGRKRVFCASLADVFEDWDGLVHNHDGETILQGVEKATLQDIRNRLFALIDETPNLDWLILTKRPQNVRRMYVPHCSEKVLGHVSQNEGDGRRIKRRENVWLLTSVSDQPTADAMVHELLKCRDLVPVLGLSCEPLLGPIRLDTLARGGPPRWLTREIDHNDPTIDWIIVGGESGPVARPGNVAWIRSIVEQCKAASVPCFVKQLGSHVLAHVTGSDGFDWPAGTMLSDDPVDADENARFSLRDGKGGDPAEWPDDLCVRQFPRIENEAPQ